MVFDALLEIHARRAPRNPRPGTARPSRPPAGALPRPLLRTPQDDLLSGEDIAKCPSCSLLIRVVFDPDALDAFVATADAAATTVLDATSAATAEAH